MANLIELNGTENTEKQEALELIKSLTYDKIDAHIENVFGNLNTNQKESLKKLYKAVLYMAKLTIRHEKELSNGLD